MAEIRLLDPQVANQIAAGEVVERPVSVVKELVENALDAGATRIQVEADEGGRRIHILDNGHGIPPDSVKLAFQRFATSKLSRYEDIWQLNTMGFRGEALPSIASVSQIKIFTRLREQELGYEVSMRGGEVISEGAAGGPPGTRIELSELFFNTPARQKFLARESTELGHIQQVMQAFALAHPQVAFKWIKKGKLSLETQGQNDLMGAVQEVFGKDFAASLYSLSHESRGLKLEGALSYPDTVRKNKNHQFFFVNERWVKVPALSRILEDLHADLIPKRHYPVAVLKLTLPGESVDVNVHPTKKEVKFKNFSMIYQLLKEAMDHALAEYQLDRQHFWDSPQMQKAPPQHSNQGESADALPPFSQPQGPAPGYTAPGAGPVESFSTSTDAPAPTEELPPFAPQDTGESLAPRAYSIGVQESAVAWKSSAPEVLNLPGFESSAHLDREAREKEDIQRIIPIGQICENTYIVGLYGRDIALIDQHVAEERFLYENMLDSAEMVSQPLLVSVIIDVTEAQKSLAEEHRLSFEQAGFEFEAYGPDSLAIRALPQCMKIQEAEHSFRKILDDLQDWGTADVRTEAFKRMCKTVACHSAIRAGDPLTLEQMQEIVKNWSKTRNPYTCPHGRPILIKISKDEVNRRFLRSWS